MNAKDLGPKYEFAWGGARYLCSKVSTLAGVAAQRGLHGEDSVCLDRPLLGVVGFMGRMSDTARLMEHLSENGQNGGQVYYLKGDLVYRDSEFQEAMPPGWTDPQARVFQLVPRERSQSPEVTAEQIGPALQKIQSITGQPKADLAAHSLGGLGARIYATRGGQGIGRLMMVGTPNLGLRAATLAEWVVNEQISWAMKLANVGPAALPALQWLRATADGNDKLEQLNRQWPQAKQNLEAVRIVGSGGRLTATSDLTGWGDGDGLVNSASLALPDTETKILPGTWTQGHISLMNDRQVFHEMRDFFQWKVAN
ncbi:hypothetical protein JST97_22100 [bacterium]|nr:hypothetical protein [bacterium]